MSNDSRANRRQIGGDHYATGGAQHWDWAASLPYLEGQATKYIGRHHLKNGLEDVMKAAHFLEKIVETRYPGFVLRIALGREESHVDIGQGLEPPKPPVDGEEPGPAYVDQDNGGLGPAPGSPDPTIEDLDPSLDETAPVVVGEGYSWKCPKCDHYIEGGDPGDIMRQAAEHVADHAGEVQS